MKLLLDECVVQDFRHALQGHDVFTVAFMGWAGVKNGQLLALAAGEGFEAFLTTDRGIEHEQNTNVLPLTVIILYAASNDLADLVPLVPQILMLLGSMPAKQILRARI